MNEDAYAEWLVKRKDPPYAIPVKVLMVVILAVSVFLALFLQAMYGAADLIIVGRFAGTLEQSGVASGSQLFNTVTMVITGHSAGCGCRCGRLPGFYESQRGVRVSVCGGGSVH